MVVSQPFIEQEPDDPANETELEAFFHDHSFQRKEHQHDALPELKGVTWYRQRDGVLVADAHARNFRKAPDGFLIPVDVMITLVPQRGSKILPCPDEPWAPSLT